MGASQRRKGHDFERAIARLLRGLGFEARRGQQAHNADDCDVVVDGSMAWLELKCGKRISIWEAIEQAKRQCGEKTPVVVAKKTRGETLVCLRLEDVVEAINALVD